MKINKKELNKDINCLKIMCKALEKTSARMRKASLEFAWDKYVNQPIRDRIKTHDHTQTN